MDRSLLLDPKLHGAQNWRVLLEIFRGDHDEAARLATRFARAQPDEATAWARAALAAMYDRRFEDALDHIERACAISPEVSGFEMAPVELIRAVSLAALGRLEEAEAFARPMVTQHLERMGGKSRGWVYPWRLAVVSAAVGDTEEALDWLEAAQAAGFVFPQLLERHPALDGLRDTERFQRVLEGARTRLAQERAEAGVQ